MPVFPVAGSRQGRSSEKNNDLVRLSLSDTDRKKEGADPTVIKKYANRRLYNTGTSTYVTLDDLAAMVKNGEDFVVRDAKSGEEITHSVLTQIIFDQESKGENLLPISFLRQLIGFYGDSMQALLPSYLNQSIDTFANNQSLYREHMSNSFGANALGAIDEQVKRNAKMFEQAMRMFSPFAAPPSPSTEQAASSDDDIDAVKRRLAEMEKRLEELSKKS
ncbi:MAG: polyhydroxyalkanoate synthesis repressor PhaR [Rhodobiaceae bacterium]|nr:polyhydroxyalkanoate synthesis repressor PhaR [Rhodobiaceae bacterium]